MRRLLLLCWPLAALAAEPADLPPAAAVARALTAHPAVRAATAGIAVGEANRALVAAGPHEFNLRLSSQQRRDAAADRRYAEQAIAIERALRLPGKAAHDTAYGEAGVDEARLAFEDARHETARRLLAGWFGWQREAAAAREWAAQVVLLEGQRAAAARRVAAGDAARLEAMLAEAQLAQAEAALVQAQARAQIAAGELAAQFPALPLPAAPAAAEPGRLDGPPAAWRDKLVAQNHELRLARAATRRQQLAARRLDAERLPDPTLGLAVSRERDGQERVVGLQISIPLPGEARHAAAGIAAAEAAAAAAREAQARIKAEADSGRGLAQAEAAFAHWQRLAAVAARMDDNARLLDRAWRLGEGQFAELQLARRQAVEARLAESQARLDAAEARYRVLLDAHELWPDEPGE